MKLFVGNLNFTTTEDELLEFLEEYAEITAVKIIKDKDSGRSKGFGFIEVPTDEQADLILDNVNGAELHGKVLKVDHAKEKEKPLKLATLGYRKRER